MKRMSALLIWDVSTVFHSTDEAFYLDNIMEKLKRSKVAHWADKLAVESEPNLTTAQLMLYNHDLKLVYYNLVY
ncbi:hypothetical protein CFE70_001420 [Pyrenophora teres f. teres 0-1]